MNGHVVLAFAERPFSSLRRSRPRLALWDGYALRLLFVIAAYYAAAHLGYAFEFSGPIASIVWLPVGVGVAFLYLLGLRLWPGVIVGDLLVNNYPALPDLSAIGQSLGNLLEVVIAAVLLRRFASRNPLLGSIAGVAGILLALTAGTVVSATIGLLSLFLGHAVTLGSVPRLWRTWWLGDLCGALIVVPLAIAWFPLPRRRWFDGRGIELTLMLLSVAGLITVAWQTGRPLYYAVPALTWAGLRFGPRGGTLAIAIGVAFTLWVATDELGPFASHAVERDLLNIQVYLALSAVATLAVAALAREREQLAEDVRASRTRIVAASDDERRRIERNIHDGAQQRLVALAFHLGRAADEANTKPATAAASFESAQAELQVAIDELRELVRGIRPPALRQFGLASAIELAAARSGAPVEVVELPHERLDDTAEATAYYVVLEAITNAQRYAHASVVRLRARLTPGSLKLEIDDDGVGGAVEQDDLGIQGLRDRVEATGGRFTIESERGAGTRIAAEIPAIVVAHGSS